MADNGNPFGNWKHFEELFNGIHSMQQGKMKDMGWVDKFISGVMKQNVPAPLSNIIKHAATAPSTSASSSSETAFDAETFETHRNVLVRIHIPSNVDPRQLQLFANSTKVKVEGPGSQVQYIKLPTTVQSNSSKAEFLDGVLQLQLRKKAKSDRYDELYIRFL